MLAGAVNATLTCPLPDDAVPIVGAPGTVAGVTTLEALDEMPAPMEFVALTVHVYGVPLVNPVTVIDGGEPAALWAPHVAV